MNFMGPQCHPPPWNKTLSWDYFEIMVVDNLECVVCVTKSLVRNKKSRYYRYYLDLALKVRVSITKICPFCHRKVTKNVVAEKTRNACMWQRWNKKSNDQNKGAWMKGAAEWFQKIYFAYTNPSIQDFMGCNLHVFVVFFCCWICFFPCQLVTMVVSVSIIFWQPKISGCFNWLCGVSSAGWVPEWHETWVMCSDLVSLSDGKSKGPPFSPRNSWPI